MLRTRSRLIAVPLAAAALTLTGAGFHAVAADSSASGGAPSSAAAPCLADATTLVGDLDGDGNPDKISNPGHTGTKMTIQWGTADGTFGKKVSVNDLLGVKDGEIASAAVADFKNDGTLGMVVNIVEPASGDDANTARLSEYRPAPLDRSDLGSSQAIASDVGEFGEVQELSVAQYDGDAYPDLAILNNPGDGQMDREVRLSKTDGGLADRDGAANDEFGEWGSRADPPAMPTDGWSQFFESCS